jgi:hypothetical protein
LAIRTTRRDAFSNDEYHAENDSAAPVKPAVTENRNRSSVIVVVLLNLISN